MFLRPSSRVSSVMPLPTPSTLNERPLPRSMSSMLLKGRDVLSTVSVVKRSILMFYFSFRVSSKICQSNC